MTYFIDSLETSFKYLAGCHQTTLGKSYASAEILMPKVIDKNVILSSLLDTVFIVDVRHAL